MDKRTEHVKENQRYEGVKTMMLSLKIFSLTKVQTIRAFSFILTVVAAVIAENNRATLVTLLCNMLLCDNHNTVMLQTNSNIMSRNTRQYY